MIDICRREDYLNDSLLSFVSIWKIFEGTENMSSECETGRKGGDDMWYPIITLFLCVLFAGYFLGSSIRYLKKERYYFFGADMVLAIIWIATGIRMVWG